MTGGTEFSEVQEISKETPEVAEAKQQLERATIEPAAELEKVGDVKQSEDLEKEVVAAVEAAPKLETPPAVTLEGAGAEGKVTIEKAADTAADGGRVTEDREVVAAETAADGGRKTEDRVEVAADETVMIDTVPFPERPAAAAEAGSREAIGTWPTPEVPAKAGATIDPAAIIDTNDRETSPGSEGETSVGGSSATIAKESDGQDESKPGEYGFHYEFNDDTPEMGEYSRADVSTDQVDFGDNSIAADDDNARLAGVEAGAIATAEANASTAKTIGTESSRESGIPVEDDNVSSDTQSPAADGGMDIGNIPGGLEVGSIEEVEQEILETGEPTPSDETNPESSEDVQDTHDRSDNYPEELVEHLAPIQEIIDTINNEIKILEEQLNNILVQIEIAENNLSSLMERSELMVAEKARLLTILNDWPEDDDGIRTITVYDFRPDPSTPELDNISIPKEIYVTRSEFEEFVDNYSTGGQGLSEGYDDYTDEIRELRDQIDPILSQIQEKEHLIEYHQQHINDLVNEYFSR